MPVLSYPKGWISRVEAYTHCLIEEKGKRPEVPGPGASSTMSAAVSPEDPIAAASRDPRVSAVGPVHRKPKVINKPGDQPGRNETYHSDQTKHTQAASQENQ